MNDLTWKLQCVLGIAAADRQHRSIASRLRAPAAAARTLPRVAGMFYRFGLEYL